jgi:PTH2 family peptidyl-tRNA hydrolase
VQLFPLLSLICHQILSRWESCGQPKITLKVKDEKEMLELMHKAKEAGIAAKAIKDAGRTQVASGSRTVLAIGPGICHPMSYIF